MAHRTLSNLNNPGVVRAPATAYGKFSGQGHFRPENLLL
jgi:hypothetical protein